MFKRSLSIFLSLSILTFSLTGCYDNHSIEESAYPVAVAIDASANNMIYLTVQFPKSPSASDAKDSQSSEITTTTVECFDIDSGLNLINSYLGKQINLSHCKVLAFSEIISIKGLSKYFYSLTNNVEVRPDCNIIITRCDAKDFLKSSEPILETPTSRFYEMFIDSGKYTGFIYPVGVSSFYSDLCNSTIEATGILGGLNANTNEIIRTDYASTDNSYKAGEVPTGDDGIIENMGTAVFRGDKLVGELNSLETICHLLVSNKLENAVITIPSPFEIDETIDLYLGYSKKAKNKVEMVNGSPYIKTTIHLKAFGISSSNTIDYSTEENLALIKEFATSYLQKQISNYLYKTAKELNSDIIGFGKYLISDYLTIQEWDEVNWLENYKNSFFDVTVDININNGNLFTKM